MKERLENRHYDLSSKLEIYNLQKDELSCQIDGEKNLLKEKQNMLNDVNDQVSFIKRDMVDKQKKYLDEQEKNFRNEISIFSFIPSLCIGGLVLAFGGISVAGAALVSGVGSFLVISKGIYSNKINKFKNDCIERYCASVEYLNLDRKLANLIKKRHELDDEIFEIKYEINRYTNEINILTSKIIYTKSELSELANGSVTHNVVDLDALVVRALK